MDPILQLLGRLELGLQQATQQLQQVTQERDELRAQLDKKPAKA